MKKSFSRVISKYPMSRRKFVRSKASKFFKNKYTRVGLLTAATTGTLFTILPKETIEKAADTVQNLGETVYDLAEDLGDTTGSLVRAVGSSVDGISNGLGFISENFNTFVFVTGLAFTGWIASKAFKIFPGPNTLHNKE